MLLVPVVLATLMFAWMAHRGMLPALDARPVHFPTREPIDGALEIARQRLNRGEIDAEEYARIRAILED